MLAFVFSSPRNLGQPVRMSYGGKHTLGELVAYHGHKRVDTEGNETGIHSVTFTVNYDATKTSNKPQRISNAPAARYSLRLSGRLNRRQAMPLTSIRR